jgi:tetratricopeptide (TPR) repeat protein
MMKAKEPIRMRSSMIRCFALALLFYVVAQAGAAEEYWSYSYGNFDVTTAGDGAHAGTLVHTVARFDVALSKILQLPDIQIPTHIYFLPAKEAEALLGKDDAAAYKFSGYEVTTVSGPESGSANRYWGALFGYTGALLVNGRASRFPFWFQVGVPYLFANTEFEGDRIRTGGVIPGFAQTLQHGGLIPMRTFLRLQHDDPQLKNSTYMSMYSAESWYLAREIYVENKLRPEFAHYFAMLKNGENEQSAFAASFKFDYEDLDKRLAADMSAPVHVFVVPVPREPANEGSPQQLSVAEAKGRVAELNLEWAHRAAALQLAAEALQADPKNERALRVMARANMQEGNFAVALAAADRVTALSAPSAAGLTDCGNVLAALAHSVAQKEASVGVDADTLTRRAKETYERALSLDAEYLRSWAGLAYVYSSGRDADAVRAFLSRVKPVMEKHSYSGALAQALARMCLQTGQTQDAFVFAEFWRDDAINLVDLDHANAFISRLKTNPTTGGGA